MNTYRKRPVEVTAVQWTGDNLAEMAAFAPNCFAEAAPWSLESQPEMTAEVYDELHSTWVLLRTGDWVVRGIRGEFYPVERNVFYDTYEPAT